MEETEGLGLGHRDTPDDGAGERAGLAGDRSADWGVGGVGVEKSCDVLLSKAEILDPIHDGLHAEGFVNEDDVGALAAGNFAAESETFADSGNTEVRGGAEDGAHTLDGERLSFAKQDGGVGGSRSL